MLLQGRTGPCLTDYWRYSKVAVTRVARKERSMELKEVLGRRRSIRFFLPFRPVERAKVQKMLEAARRSSCVGNVNSARAVVIWKDQASEDLLRAITPPLGYQQMQT